MVAIPSMAPKLRGSALAAISAALVLIVTRTAEAQSPYIAVVSTTSYNEFSNGTSYVPLAYGFRPAWDEGSAAIPLPFAFSWFGTSYTTIYAFTNGFLSFSPAPGGSSILGPPGMVPSTSFRNHNYIGAMWQDLEGDPNLPVASSIRALTSGPAGSRTFTIQYHNFYRVSVRPPGSLVNFQVNLHEDTQEVEILFGPNNGILNGTTAIENADGTQGMNLLAPSASCPAATCACNPMSCGSTRWPSGRMITISPPAGPAITGSISGPLGAFPGTMFVATVGLQNIGQAATPAFRYEIRISPTNTSTRNSTLLESVDVPGGLGPASSTSVMRTLRMPPAQPLGEFYLVLVIDPDHAVMEALPLRHVIFDSHTIATASDLTGTLVAPSRSGPGEPIALSLTVRSAGAPTTQPIRVRFWLSTHDVRDPTDVSMGTAMVTIPDGRMTTAQITMTVPATASPSPPPYRILADINDDHAIPETVYTNNLAVSGPVTLVGIDLEGRSVESGPIGFLGLPYPVTTTLRNSGGAGARGFTICIVLARTPLITLLTNTILITSQPLTLLSGEEATYSFAPVIPTRTATGTWYVASIANCTETIQLVNPTRAIARRMGTIIVRAPGPDLSPVEIQTATVAAAGETTLVVTRIANLGNVAGGAPIRLVLSQMPSPAATDLALYNTPNSITLPAGVETSLAVWASLPGDLASGVYYIAAIVDPDRTVDQLRRDNKTIVSRPIAIAGSNMAITTPSPPNAVIGVPYVRRFNAVGGLEPYVWSLTWDRDMAPPGLSFDAATAELKGTPEPAAEGRYNFTVRVTSGAQRTSRAYSLIVTQPTIPLSIVSSRLPPAIATEPYMLQLVAVGGTPPYRWSLAGPPPAGLGLTENGLIGGSPRLVGAYTFMVAVEDLAGARAMSTLALDVVDANATLTISTADIPTGVVGVAYEASFAVSGGVRPYTWRLESSSPLPGLTFDPISVQLTGTPTVAGRYPLVVEVRDRNGLFDRDAYVLEILAPGEIVILTGQSPDAALPKGKVGAPYLTPDGMMVRLRALRRAGGAPSSLRWTIADGALPPGLAADPATGLITGVPTASGKYPFRVLVTSPNQDFAFASLMIEVTGPDMGKKPAAGSSGCSCGVAGGAAEGERRGRKAGSTLGLLALAGLLFFARRRRMSTLALGLGTLVSAPNAAEAQTVIPYQVTATVEPYVLLAGGTEIIPGLGDANTTMIGLPFDFYLYGVPYRALFVNANGIVSVLNFGFGHNIPLTRNPDPSPSAEKGFVAPLWEDWCASPLSFCSFLTNPGTGIFYRIDTGTPGNRSITIEYRRVRHARDSQRATDVTFKMVLWEGAASRIDFYYGPMSLGTSFGGPADPTQFRGTRIGVEDALARNGMWVPPCAGAVACDARQVLDLPNKHFMLVADAGPDIAADSPTIPAIGYPGLPLPITFRLSNRHNAPMGPSRFAAYVVQAAATSTAGGIRIYASAPLTLGPFEGRQIDFAAEIPNDLPVGQYRIAVFADYLNELVEIDKRNNVAISTTTVRIADRAPEFRVTAVRPLETERAPGQTIDVGYGTGNFGNAAGRLELQAYLSSSRSITTAGVRLGDLIAIDTAPRQVVTGTLSAPIPTTIPTGRYWVGLISDPMLRVDQLSRSQSIGRSAAPILIAGAEVVIVTETLPPATIGQRYSAVIRAAGGRGVYTYRVSDGTLPGGINFNPGTAEISGVPLSIGRFEVELEATSGAASGRKTFPFIVLDPTAPLTVVTRDLPSGMIGQQYSVPVRVVGGVEPYRWRIAGGVLPSGIALGDDGSLVGFAHNSGSSTFDIEISDNAGASVSTTLSLTIRPPINITVISSQLGGARLGEPYSETLIAAGGIRPIHWRAVMPPPPGLLVSDDGSVHGIPEKAGDFRFRVEATDSKGSADTNLIAIHVDTSGRFGVKTDVLPEGRPGADYRTLITGEGGKLPYTWEVVKGEGSLPMGFRDLPSEGIMPGETTNDLVLRGHFDAEGTWTFTVRLRDAAGRVANRPFVLTARAPSGMAATATPQAENKRGCSCSSAAHAENAGSARPTAGSALGLLLLLIAGALALGRRRLVSAWSLLAVVLVSACGSDRIVAITPVLRAAPLHLDFGTVELGQEAKLTVTIENLEAVSAKLKMPEVTDNCGGCFLVINPVDRIRAYEKYQLEIRFRAIRLPVATGTVSIQTDSPKAPVLKITTIGRGSDLRRPCISVIPERLDFGFVPAGGIAVSSFVVRSCGTNDLLIDRIAIDPPGAPFKVTTSTPSPENPGRLAPGAQASVSLRASPPLTTTGTIGARVLIKTNVIEELNVPGQAGAVQVPLRALASLPPLAICGPNQTVEPWSRASLDCSMSRDQNVPPNEPLTFRWRLLNKPGGSTTRMERANTPFGTFWVDLTGRYEAEIVVTSSLGLESEPKLILVEALPTNAIRIELTWDHPDSDLDLHLIRGETGRFCDCATDCHYRDCARTPDWFGIPAQNPRLDHDARMGFGPENINIDGEGAMRTVHDGVYLVAVHYYASNAGVSHWPTRVSNATLRVFIFGLLAGELTRAMQDDGDLWMAARIDWPAQTVTADGRVVKNQRCGAF